MIEGILPVEPFCAVDEKKGYFFLTQDLTKGQKNHPTFNLPGGNKRCGADAVNLCGPLVN